METEIEEEKNVSTYNDENQGGSRYLTSKKKQYLLASNMESIGLLIQSQVDQLTDLLIQQKSEYDKLTRESNIKKEQTELLDKKIKALQGMDEKTKKKAKENKESIDTMKSVIKLKNGRKAEENYNKKTLQKNVDKLDQDILLIQKEILDLENKGKILDKKLQKAKFNENTIRQKKNDVYSQIESQQLKNKYSKNEQDLIIQYYQTIIKQKYMFIQSADERKEKQKKIAQEAKNDSQDKQEIEKRHELHLLVLFNQYLREKMGELIQSNEKMEATLEEIRDITGTENLDLLVETILLRDKRYNYCCKLVAETEKKKIQLKEELNDLKNQYIELKNEVLIQEEKSDDAKSISTIPTTHVEDDEKELIAKEQLLNKNLYDIGEKHNIVNLAYAKVLENINALKDLETTDDKEEEAELHLEEEENYEKNNPILKSEEKNNMTTNLETNKDDEKEKGENKEGDNNENKEDGDNKDDENENKEGEDNVEKKEGEENEEGEEEEKPKEIILTEDEEKAIKDYSKFLQQSSKKFDILFLLHSKQEFLNIMAEKGKQIEKENELARSQALKPSQRKVTRRITKQRKTNRLLTSLSRISRMSKINVNQSAPLIVIDTKKKEEDDDKSNYDPDRDILRKFLNEQKKERDDYIKVNQEIGKNKKTGK